MNTLLPLTGAPLKTLMADRGNLSKVLTTKLIENLNSGDSRTRCDSARELGERVKKGRVKEQLKVEAVINALIDALTHKDLMTAQAADNALVQIGKPAIPALYKLLYEGNDHQRESVLICLGNMREKAREALQAIRAVVRENDETIKVRLAAVWALGNIVSKLGDSEETKSVVMEISNMLKTDSTDMLLCATEALGKLGARAKGAEQDIEPLLEHENDTVKNTAKWALTQINPNGAKGIKPVYKEINIRELLKRIEDDNN